MLPIFGSVMQECIDVHVGQAGVQMKSVCLELCYLKPAIPPDGQMPSDKIIGEGGDSFNTSFSETDPDEYVPRAVFVDRVMDEVHAGICRQLFQPDQRITGKEDAANIYVHGHCTICKVVDLVLYRISNRPINVMAHGVLILYSIRGWTGSEFTSRPMNRLCV